MIVNDCFSNYSNHGNCLDAPPQRAPINVYNLHISLVKIYNTISLEKWLLTTI